ncbi:MAG TPA: ComEA family DNA-binding protein [Candidatus Paceibacterota bacterium]
MGHTKILIAMVGLLLAAAAGVFVFFIQGNAPTSGEIAKEVFVAGVEQAIEQQTEGEVQEQENEVFEAVLQTPQAAPEPAPQSKPVPVPVPAAVPQAEEPESDSTPEPVPPPSVPTPSLKPPGKININTAGLEELDQITGVGPAIAQKIIDYRNAVSLFYQIEDIKNVSGIGEVTFEKMKGEITVGNVSPAPTPTPTPAPEPSPSGKININTAGYEELQEITGVGKTIAQNIIDYREANGPFTRIEDIMNVPLIAEGRFENMKNEITI